MGLSAGALFPAVLEKWTGRAWHRGARLNGRQELLGAELLLPVLPDLTELLKLLLFITGKDLTNPGSLFLQIWVKPGFRRGGAERDLQEHPDWNVPMVPFFATRGGRGCGGAGGAEEI